MWSGPEAALVPCLRTASSHMQHTYDFFKPSGLWPQAGSPQRLSGASSGTALILTAAFTSGTACMLSLPVQYHHLWAPFTNLCLQRPLSDKHVW